MWLPVLSVLRSRRFRLEAHAWVAIHVTQASIASCSQGPVSPFQHSGTGCAFNGISDCITQWPALPLKLPDRQSCFAFLSALLSSLVGPGVFLFIYDVPRNSRQW